MQRKETKKEKQQQQQQQQQQQRDNFSLFNKTGYKFRTPRFILLVKKRSLKS